MKKITNTVDLDGEPKIQVLRRPSIKLASKPQIVIAMPVGDKQIAEIFECSEKDGGCGKKWIKNGVRTPNLIPVQWSLHHMNMVPPLNVAMSYLVEAGRLSAEARQIMTKKAIRMGAKYILFWDDDVLPPMLGLYTLHNWMELHPDAGAISGVYTSREDPCEPLIYKEHGAGAYWDFPMGDGAEPVPIFGAGAGFILARVEAINEVIDSLKAANGGDEVPIWADERTLPDDPSKPRREKGSWGHDVRFCKLLNEHDWPVYVHGQVLCGHIDIHTGVIYKVPEDAPGLKMQRQKNINTADYWDTIYGQEGPNTWRQYPEMFEKVVAAVPMGTKVVELGCGVGILGSRLTASKAVSYCGFDISEQAVKIAQARFLRAEVRELPWLFADDLNCHTVIATEVLEHLTVEAMTGLFRMIQDGPAKLFIFTAPDGCMPPEEVPEHAQDFSKEYAVEAMKSFTDNGWTLDLQSVGDGAHLIGVLQRGDVLC